MTPLTIDDDDPQQCFVYEENILLEALKNESNILSENFKLRPLKKDDFRNDYLPLLGQLTKVGDVTRQKFDEIFSKMKNNGYYVTVIEDINSEKVVGSATLFIEYKFIHGGCLRGRIEDVVVDANYRGKKLGIGLIETLKAIAKYLKCYKLTLDCKDELIPWYQKFGFIKEDGNSNFMTIRFYD